MTFRFGKKSQDNLAGVHPALVDVCNAALFTGIMDFSVVDGLRTREEQERLYREEKTKTLHSKHLRQSTGYGHAVDLYPYPIDMNAVNKGHWPEIIRFGVLAGLMKTCAMDLGVKIRWGCDWDNDGETLDHSFFDAPHFELVTI